MTRSVLIPAFFFAFSSLAVAQTPTLVESRPCKESPGYRGMDFWVGEWEVETAQGRPAGSSKIELVLDGCIVVENWTGRNGYAGKSFNLYHSDSSKWEQFWVDNQGQVTRREGLNDPKIYQEFFDKLSKSLFLEANEI